MDEETLRWLSEVHMWLFSLGLLGLIFVLTSPIGFVVGAFLTCGLMVTAITYGSYSLKPPLKLKKYLIRSNGLYLAQRDNLVYWINPHKFGWKYAKRFNWFRAKVEQFAILVLARVKTTLVREDEIYEGH